MLNKVQHIVDKIIHRYFLPMSITMLIHMFFFAILIVFEMSKPEKPAESTIIIDFSEPEIIQQQNDKIEIDKGEDSNSDVKNVEKNLAEKNASDKDYYREAKELLKSAQGKETFHANDYKDLRWLIKDYSSVIPDIKDWDKPDNNTNQEGKEKQATYSGNAIVSYDLGGRRAVRLPIPAYKCIGYGKVVVEVHVNPKGQVVSARISEASASLNETCLPQSALDAAQRSRFQPNDKAPSLQKGFIYYTFVAQ